MLQYTSLPSHISSSSLDRSHLHRVSVPAAKSIHLPQAGQSLKSPTEKSASALTKSPTDRSAPKVKSPPRGHKGTINIPPSPMSQKGLDLLSFRSVPYGMKLPKDLSVPVGRTHPYNPSAPIRNSHPTSAKSTQKKQSPPFGPSEPAATLFTQNLRAPLSFITAKRDLYRFLKITKGFTKEPRHMEVPHAVQHR